MDKNLGFAGMSTQPSAPPPSAPPSYEEAVGHGKPVSHQPLPYPVGPPMPMPVPGASLSYQPVCTPPYPVGPSRMPTAMPTSCNVPPGPVPMPMPMSPNSSAPNQSTAQPQTQVRIIHHHVTYALSPNPVKMTCPTCQADIKTTTISDNQPSAHICCIVLCLAGCCLCSCLPYCMSIFMNVHHFCPNCKNYIGTWKG